MSPYGCDMCQFYIFLFKKCIATWQVTIVPRVKLILVVFNLVSLFIILIQFSPPIF